ncbi:sugar nucleotide-binding protein [Sulfitobacter sp. JBTF-M27]|uniref:dTDP-4-dehydrorhamnose reductase n=1 Tax=Sulfitobacter sediminilitoris TaxID=2698830 RepID=A0A6P0CFI3_9RHOB|nr:sugar nucleotide-binding protein [Sulfitobacter sediminilitoris]NEK24912.1 sugar nucleotide-binding protein [Sulfitobacter sediminilitoris]
MSRMLVFGSSGLLGRALMSRMSVKAVGTSLTREAEDRVKLDAVNAEAVRNVIEEVKPEIVVNLIAERRPKFWGDLVSLRKVNVDTARNVAEAAAIYGADLIHVSTDYVFPNGGPHSVNSPHLPTNSYGFTKSEAESAVRSENRDAIIVRMPVLYGSVERFDECNLSELVHRLYCATQPVSLDTWAKRRPTHVADVAETLAQIADNPQAWRHRNIHVSAKGWHSQFEMGRLAAQLIGIDFSMLNPVSNDNPERPRMVDLELDTYTPFLDRYRSLEQGLAEVYESYVSVG